MKILRKIREKTGSYFLKRKEKKLERERETYNLKEIKKAGIIFCINKNSDLEEIVNFNNYLKKMKIKTDVIGYYDGRNIPHSFLLNEKINFFCNKSINWYYKPISIIAKDFMNKKYDMLFDLSTKVTFPVRYITTLSNAKFKIGRYADSNSGYDLIIDIDKDADIEYYINQIKHFTTTINK